MPDWIVLALLPLAGWLPGWLALRRLDAPAGASALHPLEFHFAALSLGLFFLGWSAFFFAEVGLFSLGSLAAIWILVVLILLILERIKPLASGSPLRPASDRGEGAPGAAKTTFAGFSLPSRLEFALLALWLVPALWLFFRPHESILGGADAGVYVNTAAHVAQTGQILIHDDTLAALDGELYPALLRERPPGEGTPYYLSPGFNVVLDPPGRVIPDFLHLHPVWQAVAYAGGGLRAALLMPGLWALLGSLALYLVVRQTANWPAAMLALAGLSLNALQIWFARYPVAETLTQYLVWTGLWALGAWLAGRRPLSLWGLLAASALGLVFLTRVDMLFLLAIPLLAGLWLAARGRLRRVHLWFFIPLGLQVLHGFLHGAFISGPYFTRIGGYVRLMLTHYLPTLLALIALAGIGALLLLRYGQHLRRPEVRRRLLAPVMLTIVLLAAYAWFIRPVVGATPSYQEWYDGQTIVLTDRENLVRLGWYLSPLGVWLGIAGICLLVWRLSRRTAALVGVGLFFSLLYLWRIQATPHQIYAMRRYVPVTMPFFLAAAALLLERLAGQERRLLRWAALILIPLWLGGLIWSARGFVTHVDNQGLTSQVAQLAERLPPGSVLIFNYPSPIGVGDLLGTPLHYLHGHDAFTLRDTEAVTSAAWERQIASWQEAGRSVYWIGDRTPLDTHDITYEEAQMIDISFTFLENAYDHKPRRLIPAQWMLPLARLQ